MLKHLKISNYALISSLDMDLDEGFSVITGETGAGKSIMLGALGLIMGQRADTKAISDGEQKCVIEATFGVDGYHLEALFETHDIDYDSECVIRREVTAAGKSRAFVNDTPAPLSFLRELVTHLIDIHSQHENLLLADNAFQLRVLDTLAHNEEVRSRYAAAYDTCRRVDRELRQLRDTAARQAADADYLQYQYDQLTELNVRPGEKEELEAELLQLSHAEDIRSALYAVATAMQGDEGGILTWLEHAKSQLASVARYHTGADELSQRMESAYIEIDDIASEIDDMAEQIDHDPKRQQYVEDRLDDINTQLQRHHVDTEQELIERMLHIEQQLNRIASYDDELRQLETQLASAQQALDDTARQLSASRRSVVSQIETQLTQQLRHLGIPHPQLVISITPLDTPQASGADDVQFLFSANKNQQLRNVADVASGGEVSRLMLCIKALLASSQALPTLIFDEIDSGVSGEVADAMGGIMQQMGQHLQLLAITHLPQIAAKGDAHYLVYKQDTDRRTESHIRRLNDAERIDQLAQMLSGANVTDAARRNACELLYHEVSTKNKEM